MRGIASVLIFVFALQVFSVQLTYTGFLFNRKYIAAELCEKRNDKGNHCHGSCHLKKQLASDSERQENNNRKSENQTELIFFRTYNEFIPDLSSFALKLLPVYPETEINPGYHLSVFHPPCFALIG